MKYVNNIIDDKHLKIFICLSFIIASIIGAIYIIFIDDNSKDNKKNFFKTIDNQKKIIKKLFFSFLLIMNFSLQIKAHQKC